LGLIPKLFGTVEIDGRDLCKLDRQSIARQIAYVPQAQIPEFPYAVIDLVVMGRTAHLGTFNGPRRANHEVAMAALDKLGTASLAERDSRRTSGGQRQLALIARALAQQTRIVVMDEPTASLDLGDRIRVLARGRCGSLLLHRSGLSPPTPCRALPPNVRDDHDTPLLAGRDGETKPNISEKQKQIFFTSGLDRRSRLILLANFDLTRMRISRW
jgi:hypothetical protein